MMRTSLEHIKALRLLIRKRSKKEKKRKCPPQTVRLKYYDRNLLLGMLKGGRDLFLDVQLFLDGFAMVCKSDFPLSITWNISISAIGPMRLLSEGMLDIRVLCWHDLPPQCVVFFLVLHALSHYRVVFFCIVIFDIVFDFLLAFQVLSGVCWLRKIIEEVVCLCKLFPLLFCRPNIDMMWDRPKVTALLRLAAIQSRAHFAYMTIVVAPLAWPGTYGIWNGRLIDKVIRRKISRVRMTTDVVIVIVILNRIRPVHPCSPAPSTPCHWDELGSVCNIG